MSETATGAEPGFAVRRATREEAETVAAIVRDAFRTEAAVYGDIPPLHETAADVEAGFDAGEVTLVAIAGSAVVGTVRGETMADGGLMVRRLAVLPAARKRGIARALLLELEAAYPDATRFELFTGNSSDAALGLYESLGYVRTGAREVAPGVELVTLEKSAR